MYFEDYGKMLHQKTHHHFHAEQTKSLTLTHIYIQHLRIGKRETAVIPEHHVLHVFPGVSLCVFQHYYLQHFPSVLELCHFCFSQYHLSICYVMCCYVFLLSDTSKTHQLSQIELQK